MLLSLAQDQETAVSVAAASAFMRESASSVQTPSFAASLLAALKGQGADDRAALTEQVLARHYVKLWAECVDKVGAAQLATIEDALRPDVKPYLSKAAWVAYSKSVCPDDDEAPRGDLTLQKLIAALEHHCADANSETPPEARKQLETLWEEMQKAEDRVLELSRLDDDKLESKVEMDKKVEEIFDADYKDLIRTLSKMPPPEQRVAFQKIQQDAEAALGADFGSLGPEEQHAKMNSMSLEERRPVIRMNALQRVLAESQRTQRDMQSLAQKYMQIVPTMPPQVVRMQEMKFRNAAMDVLPADFLSLGAEEQHDAIQNVPFKKDFPFCNGTRSCRCVP